MTKEKAPKTYKQAKAEQKQLMFIIGPIAALILGGLGCFINIYAGLIFFAFSLVMTWGMALAELSRIKKIFCQKCGTKFDYDNCSWRTINQSTEKKKVDYNIKSKQVAEILKETLEFHCDCENCGNSTVFTKTFTTATAYSDGSVDRKNVNDFAEKFFK